MHNNLEFLDMLAIISFAIQMHNTEQLRRQATNNDVIRDIHQNIDRLDRKLDLLLETLTKHPSEKKLHDNESYDSSNHSSSDC